MTATLPLLAWPVPLLVGGRKPRITDSFGYSEIRGRVHEGVDIMYPRLPSDGGKEDVAVLPIYARRSFMPFGVPAIAVANGQVIIVKKIGTGIVINVDHKGWVSQYFHLRSAAVKDGQYVAKGQALGEIGFDPSGYALNHLHFQIKIEGEIVDPEPYLRKAQFAVNPWHVGIGIGTVLSLVGMWFLYKKFRS